MPITFQKTETTPDYSSALKLSVLKRENHHLHSFCKCNVLKIHFRAFNFILKIEEIYHCDD